MWYSEDLVASIKECEGFTSPARHLPGDRPEVITGGYGETQVHEGQVFTPALADTLLRMRLDRFCNGVMRLVHVPISQGKLDAMIDFAYNEGLGNLASSHLLRLVNAKDFAGATEEFQKWNKADGKVLAGLTHRRAMEARWFAA